MGAVLARIQGGDGSGLERFVVLHDLQVLLDPQLAHQAVALGQALVAQHLQLLPVGRRQGLGAGQHAAGALGALAHAAAVAQVRVGVLPHAGANDQVAVVLDLAVVALAESVDDDPGHAVDLDRAQMPAATVYSILNQPWGAPPPWPCSMSPTR
jgi:hypothetical protein